MNKYKVQKQANRQVAKWQAYRRAASVLFAVHSETESRGMQRDAWRVSKLTEGVDVTDQLSHSALYTPHMPLYGTPVTLLLVYLPIFELNAF